MFSKKSSKENIKESAFSVDEARFGRTIMNTISKPQYSELNRFIDFIYANDKNKFIKDAYKLKIFGLIGLFLGIGIGILFLFILPVLSVFGVIIVFVSAVLFFSPLPIFSILLKRQMYSIEKNIYLTRYDILRQIYYNLKLYGNAFFINDESLMQKQEPTLFILLKALKTTNQPTFYEKFISIAELFKDNFDLSQYFKEISEKIKGRDFETFFLEEQVENRENIRLTMSERATIKQTTTTMLLIGTGIIGMFSALGGFLQQIFGLIYIYLLSVISSSGIAASSLSSSFVIFQLLTEMPSLWLGFLVIIPIIIVLAIKMKKDNEMMFGW